MNTENQTFFTADEALLEPIGAAMVAPVVKVTPTLITETFKARKGTHRYAALACLARNFGKPVSRAKLIAAIYGADTDEKAMIGALGMCLEGARKSIKKLDLPYVIVKENATITLASVN